MEKMIAKIAECNDPKKLKQWVKNGFTEGNDALVRAARLRLYSVLPAAEPGSLEHDIWTSIHALEELESAKRGKTVRLQRTRNMIRDIGERDCVERLLLKSTPSSGFDMLVAYGMPQLLFEAVALRHRSSFGDQALAHAEARIKTVSADETAQ